MVLIPKITDQFYFTSISNLDRFNNLLPTLNLPLCKKYKMKKKNTNKNIKRFKLALELELKILIFSARNLLNNYP